MDCKINRRLFFALIVLVMMTVVYMATRPIRVTDVITQESNEVVKIKEEEIQKEETTEAVLIELEFTPRNEEVRKELGIVNSLFEVDAAEYASVQNPMGNPLPGTLARPVSVVIVHFNELYLKETVTSVLNTPSEHLINEILIIDDTSVIQVSYSMFPEDRRIRIIRAKSRLGLISARIVGGFNAQGPIMILIDAHVKPRDNWLVPVVKGLFDSHKRIMAVTCGCLNVTTWQSDPVDCVDMTKAGFKWDLEHVWEEDHNKEKLMEITGLSADEVDPDDSPITMGMFATTKSWWHTINGMDSGLKVWGGENIEVSLRTWLCGGDIKVARGTVLDHLFRLESHYSSEVTVHYERNRVRIAEAWFDEPSKARFYQALKQEPGFLDFGNIDEQRQLQSRLNCKDFSYFLRRFKNRSPVTKAYYEDDSTAV